MCNAKKAVCEVLALLLLIMLIGGISHAAEYELMYELEFDGNNAYIEVPDPESCIPGFESFSIEFWAKTSPDAGGWNLPLEWPGGDRIYVGHRVGSGWNFMITSDGSRTDTHGESYIADITGRWLFVQAVLDRKAGTQRLRVYDADNDEWHDTSVSPSPGATNPSGPLYIPSHPNDHPYQGKIKELRFWHRVRSREDARDDMDVDISGDSKGLVGFWPMNEMDGQGVSDRSDNENHGEIVAADWGVDETKVLKERPEMVMPTLLAAARKAASTHLRKQAVGIMWTLDPQSERLLCFLWDTVKDNEEDDSVRLKAIEKIKKAGLETVAQIADEPAPDEMLTQIIGEERADMRLRLAALALHPAPDANMHYALAAAFDWPMWRYDAARSADTPLELSKDLHLQWERELPEPMRAWHHQWDDRGKLDFDISYTPVAAGNKIFVPSNVTDSVTAYNIEDGGEQWRFYADGPVRLAPAVWNGKVYFTSDDGHLYCVNAETGELAWKFRAGPSAHRLLGNERIINFWAARGGPVIYDDTVYFAAGIWPLHGVFIHALDAETGEPVWVNDTTSTDYVRLPHGGATGYGGLAPQGYLAAEGDRLVMAGGRTPPVFFDRHTGRVEKASFRVKGAGGYAVHADGEGVQRNRMLQERVEALSEKISGEVFYKLAAHDRLFISTKDGHLYCFGPKKIVPRRYDYHPVLLNPHTPDWLQVARGIVEELDDTGGYALMAGAGSGDLLRELLNRSELHIVVVEPRTEKVRELRDELAAAGQYGRRAAVIEADPADFPVQPYLFNLVVSEDIFAAGIDADPAVLGHLLDRLRPYAGVAWLGAPEQELPKFLEAAEAAGIDQVSVLKNTDHLLARRTGPLTGAGQWTHQYSDSSNTNFSPDRRVKAPLGVLWFGGSSNHGVLPRHGHGPVPQVAGGRLIVPGVKDIRARCVYTGRELWKREFPCIGHPFTVLNLEARFNQGHSVFLHSDNGLGANQLGSFFVSLPDAIYVRYKTAVYRLAPESGEIVDKFQLPVESGLEGKPDWGHISVYKDMLITTVEPQVFEEDKHYSEVFHTLYDIKGRNWDGTSSQKIVALDRSSGGILWARRADTGFRHNAIVSGGGLLFVVDGLSDTAVEKMQRRGKTPPDASILALNPRSGEEVWRVKSDIFGTWLNYAEDGDMLIQGGRPGGLRELGDEPNDRIAAFQGRTGEMLWDKRIGRYWGPLSIRRDTVYMAPSGSSGRGRALSLIDGEVRRRESVQTGTASDWTYSRRYGCNRQNLSEHLITFRSGYAAYYDLKNDSGTGFLAGFRSGCTNNLVAGDGVLNAPDYTRTCTCSYAHQTSLALIHMPNAPNIESWTRYDGAPRDPEGHGINFGAPGRRVDTSGATWHDAPGTNRRHPSAIEDNDGAPDWVAASVREGSGDITIDDLLDTNYRVRLIFAELDEDVEAGERIFNVLIGRRKMLKGFDIVRETGGPFRGLAREFTVDVQGGSMTVHLAKAAGSELDPVVSGIELTVEDAD